MADPSSAKAGWSAAAVLLAGHGSSKNPDGGLSVQRHADTLRGRKLFAEVGVGFLRQKPTLKSAMAALAAPIVYVVPVFASRGYIAGSAIARELGLAGRVTERGAGRRPRRILFCDPVGTHPLIADIIAARLAALRAAHGLATAETEIVLVGHGTHRNPESARQTRRVAGRLEEMGAAGRAGAFFLEEPPRVEDWAAETRAPAVFVVPFLIASGYHGAEDLPARLGLDADDPAIQALSVEAGAAGPYDVAGRRLWYVSPVGNEPALADALIAMVAAFDADAAMED